MFVLFFLTLFLQSFVYLFPYNAIVCGSLAIAAGSIWRGPGVWVVLAGTIVFHALFVLAELSRVH